MRKTLLLVLVYFIPAIFVLLHDLYIAYVNTLVNETTRFHFSDLGWMWVNYAPASYDWVLEHTDDMIWNHIIDPVLGTETFYLSIIPGTLYGLTAITVRVLGLGRHAGKGLDLSRRFTGDFGHKKPPPSRQGRNKIKYKRK